MYHVQCFKKRFEAAAPTRPRPPLGENAPVRPHLTLLFKLPPPPHEAAVYLPNSRHSPASPFTRPYFFYGDLLFERRSTLIETDLEVGGEGKVSGRRRLIPMVPSVATTDSFRRRQMGGDGGGCF